MKKMNTMMAALVNMMTRPFASKDLDSVVYANQLPTTVKSFVINNFPNMSIAYALKKGAKYELTLNDGTEVTVLRNGTWDKVERQYEPIPQSLIPESIVILTKNFFNSDQIVKLFKTESGYQIQLANAQYFKFDTNGNFA